MPIDGSHTIQIFANDTSDITQKSNKIYFTINIVQETGAVTGDGVGDGSGGGANLNTLSILSK